MNEIAVLDKNFQSSSNLVPKLSFAPENINKASVHQVVESILAGKRRGNAQTKNRALVRGGGKKPHKQKGTGRARQGSIRAPNHIGGGRVFGPQKRDYTKKVNKKMAIKAVHSVLVDKFQGGKLTVIESLESNGKTKELFSLLNERGLLPALLITAKKDSKVLLAARNLREAEALPAEAFSVYKVLKYENLIMEKQAFESIIKKVVVAS